MPHEIQFDSAGDLYIVERDNHVVRKVQRESGIISTFAGTGVAGFSGDGGQASAAQLKSPHSIVFDRQGRLLICDIGNHRIRRVSPENGIIETYAGTGSQEPTPDEAPLKDTPLNGPRTIVLNPAGSLYLALREGNAIYRIDPDTETLYHLAGTGRKGYTGDGGPAKLATLAGPKGLAYAANQRLYVVDTENHAIRSIDLETEVITTVLGTGEAGDGPEPEPLQCRLSRPHGACAGSDGSLYIGDSEAHRIRRLKLGSN
jgi:sugar lactone lactonase YvrE